MSRDYRLRVSSPYLLYFYVQKYKSVASVGPSVAVGPCPLHTLHTLLLRHWGCTNVTDDRQTSDRQTDDRRNYDSKDPNVT